MAALSDDYSRPGALRDPTAAATGGSRDPAHDKPRAGRHRPPLIRADVVYFEGPNGRAVFSASFIASRGALLDEACDNDVSHITENVLHRIRA